MLMRCDYANDNLIVTELLKNERQIFIIEHDNYSQLIMIKTTLKVEGMACLMCESHLKDVIRNICPDAKINASYKKAEIKIISKSEPDMRRIKAEIEKTGYSFLGGHSEPYSKKGFFASLFGK